MKSTEMLQNTGGMPGGPGAKMLLSVYGQSWPTTSTLFAMASGQQWTPENGTRITKDWISDQLTRTQSTDCVRASLSSDPLNKIRPTLRTLSAQTTERTDCFVDVDSASNTSDTSLYKLTAAEFRRLSEQVRQVNVRLNNSSRRPTFKKLNYRQNGETSPQLYHTQLAFSLKAFKDKQWRPYRSESSSSTASIRTRPPSARPNTATSTKSGTVVRTSIPTPPPRARPKTIPATEIKPSIPSCRGGSTVEEDTTWASLNIISSQSVSPQQPAEPKLTTTSTPEFDALTPSVVSALCDGPCPESVYGDRPASFTSTIEKDNDKYAVEGELFHDDTVEHSDIENTAAETRISDDESDDENIPEPAVKKIDPSKLPNLNLRPEVVDSYDIPILPKGDRRKYDFDAGNINIPLYEFADALSPDMQDLDLTELCCRQDDWHVYTDKQPVDEIESKIIDRLLQMESLQLLTKEWEDTRFDKQRVVKQRSRRKSARAPSAKIKEKRCCPDCLQLACIGDCPQKLTALSQSSDCPTCSEKHCSSSCSENVYESRCRQADSEDEDQKASDNDAKVKSRCCETCQRKNNAAFINTNNALLGRPRSGNVTFSRGQCSARPRDARPVISQYISDDLDYSLNKLDLDPQNTTAQDSSVLRRRPKSGLITAVRRSFRGRDSIVPGKSFTSQRRMSLTECSNNRVKSAVRRRKSVKKKRPQTAV